MFSLKCPFHTFTAGVAVATASMLVINYFLNKKKVTAKDLIGRYNLTSHPEGGYYSETFRSTCKVNIQRNSQEIKRIASTGIYFLICPGNVSRFHKISSDEMWHFYLGGPMTVIELDNSYECGYRKTVLGTNIMNGEVLQYVVRAGVWFGSFPNEGTEFSFVGCTVAPGFEFQDFELGEKSKLITEYPRAADMIEKLT